jgi:hypothetical protein
VEKDNNYKRHTFHLESKLVEKLKDIAWWERKSLKQVVNEALNDFVKRIEKKRGGPYLPRKRNQKGRPIE